MNNHTHCTDYWLCNVYRVLFDGLLRIHCKTVCDQNHGIRPQLLESQLNYSWNWGGWNDKFFSKLDKLLRSKFLSKLDSSLYVQRANESPRNTATVHRERERERELMLIYPTGSLVIVQEKGQPRRSWRKSLMHPWASVPSTPFTFSQAKTDSQSHADWWINWRT